MAFKARRDSWLGQPEAPSPVPHPTRITVIGAGHVGVPHAVTLAKKCAGVRVTVVDEDERKISAWNSPLLPFYEPCLLETLEEVRGTNLFFTTDLEAAIASAEMVFVSVSTPLKDSGVNKGYAPDLQHWEKMARVIAKAATSPKVIVERSTVPVKTASAMAAVLTAVNPACAPWVVLSNPEFSREGMAMFDQASPERVMIGGDESEKSLAALESLAALYNLWVPRSKILPSSLWSAELSKLTANAFLAQRVSSINAISALCEATGADVNEVSFAVGVDSRIGRKGIQASVGFGGACYETHLRNLVYLSKSYRLPVVAKYWESVIKMNDYQKTRFAKQIVSAMFNTVSGKKVSILGFAYKKNTSDVRFSPAIDVCKVLLRERAALKIVDPQVSAQAIKVALTNEDGTLGNIDVEAHAYTACAGAHALVVLTDWDEFARLDFSRIYEEMQKPAFIFDGRNLLNHERLRRLGFNVFAIGKASPNNVVSDEIAERKAMEAAAAKARVLAGAAPLPHDEEVKEPRVDPSESFGGMA
ncbi:hypothetical protein AB1Y20_010928 [Prymnesium parvum]|uniref:UDP-glucose 6-dehydrogenase n=1 Tax=Prymnesium parvum TaxID=97485 RepID=A0AB34IPW3_PRYPA